MRILVTGGAGYLGSILVPMLLNDGHDVTVVDSFMYQQTSLLDCCWNPRLTVVRGDVRDRRLLEELVPKADAIFPLACLTGAPICAKEPEAARAVNLEQIKTIAGLAGRGQRIIYPCTNSGYGIGEADIYCDEDSPLRPISVYGRVKVEAEAFLLDRGDCVTFRFATLFGVSPRMRLDLLVNDFTFRAVIDRFVVLFEPHFKRNYLHVRDGAGVFRHALANYDAMKGRTYNVGLSDANLSKWELCEVIRKHVPEFYFVAAEIGEDPDKRNYLVSNQRIEDTGFRTTVGLDDGHRRAGARDTRSSGATSTRTSDEGRDRRSDPARRDRRDRGRRQEPPAGARPARGPRGVRGRHRLRGAACLAGPVPGGQSPPGDAAPAPSPGAPGGCCRGSPDPIVRVIRGSGAGGDSGVPVSGGFHESLGCDVCTSRRRASSCAPCRRSTTRTTSSTCAIPSTSRPQLLAWREAIYPAGCHFAQTVVVGSQWVKEDVVRRYRVDPDKIQVIAEAAPTQTSGEPTAADLERIRAAYQLDAPFLLFPGVTWAHKNHLRLFEALARLRDDAGVTLNLICTGSRYPSFWPSIEAGLRQYGLDGQARFLGYVPDARPAGPVSARLVPGVPVPLRGQQPADLRGVAGRSAGGLLERHRAARAGPRRRPAVRSDRRGGDRRRHRRGSRPTRTSGGTCGREGTSG